MPELLATRALTEPGVFRESMRETMVAMNQSFPMDVVKMMSIFLDVDEGWLEEEFYPEEMIEAFEVVMRVNSLDELMRLGLSVGMISFGDLTWLTQVAKE